MGNQDVLSNLMQSTEKARGAFTNLTTTNTTLMGKVVIYANRLSTKESDQKAIQTEVRNFQGKV